jgi:hypothetical protein
MCERLASGCVRWWTGLMIHPAFARNPLQNRPWTIRRERDRRRRVTPHELATLFLATPAALIGGQLQVRDGRANSVIPE